MSITGFFTILIYDTSIYKDSDGKGSKHQREPVQWVSTTYNNRTVNFIFIIEIIFIINYGIPVILSQTVYISVGSLTVITKTIIVILLTMIKTTTPFYYRPSKIKRLQFIDFYRNFSLL